MADEYYHRVKFGGTISKEKLQLIYDQASETFDEIDSFDTWLETKDCYIQIYGMAYFDDAENFESLLIEHDLSFTIAIDPRHEFSGEFTYNFPDLVGHTCSDINGNATQSVSSIRPCLDFIMDLYTKGEETLPLNLNHENEMVKSLAVKITGNPLKKTEIVKEHLDRIIPNIPNVPPIIIEE